MIFTLGQKVHWTSQGRGSAREKEGEIVQVVPAGQCPDRNRFEQLYRSSGVGLPRHKESYVVQVGSKFYWPFVSALRLAQVEEAKRGTPKSPAVITNQLLGLEPPDEPEPKDFYQCPECGYALVSIADDGCPNCGAVVGR